MLHPCTFFPINTMSFPGQEEFNNGINDSSFFTIREAKSSAKKESPEKEKQILVDPISIREPSFSLMLPPILTQPTRDATVPLPPVLPPAKPRFLSSSLSNAAVSISSPRLSSFLSKKRWKNESQASPRKVHNIARQQSALVQSHSDPSLLQDGLVRKSKSCGEGRASAPSDELDFCFKKTDMVTDPSFTRADDTNKYIHNSSSSKKLMDSNDDQEFKCGALCLFLPGFSKAKVVRPRKEEKVVMENVISRTVSLEKFECGSWASSGIVNEHDEDGDSMNHLYFDLPLELIRNSVNDAHSPINAAFVFDKNVKGVLKNGSSRTSTTTAAGAKAHEASRHVRFSVSSPTSYPSSPASCITPRLHKAREEFNAFLEAQSA